jgi:hypothetical protein
MGEYEIRVVRADGSPSLVYNCTKLSDTAAINMAKHIRRNPGDCLEIWRGMECIHFDPGSLIQPSKGFLGAA